MVNNNYYFLTLLKSKKATDTPIKVTLISRPDAKPLLVDASMELRVRRAKT